MSTTTLTLIASRTYRSWDGYTIKVFDDGNGGALIRRTGWAPGEWRSPDRTAEEWARQNLGDKSLIAPQASNKGAPR